MRIHSRWTFWLAALLGCGAEIPDELVGGGLSGYLQVEVATTGADPDLDGYLVSLEDNAWKPLPSNGSIALLAKPAGRREVKLTGVATNCVLSNGPSREVEIPEGGVATVRFSVSCVARVGSLTVKVTSSGEVPEKYWLQIDGETERPIGTTDSVAIAGLPAGEHAVTLWGVLPICSLDGAIRRMVEVPHAGTASVSFTVNCNPRLVNVVVRTVTTGLDLDPDGYVVSTESDRAPATTIPAPLTGAVEFPANTGAWLMVALRGLPPHCHVTVDGTPGATRYYSGLTTGSTLTVSFSVVCEAALTARLPVGRQLAFVRDGGIHLVNADGTGLVQLTHGYADARPSWSPDGRRLAFVRSDGDVPGIQVVEVDGGRLLATYGGFDPSWSPDGNQVAYASLYQGSYHLFVADLRDEEGRSRRITNLGGTSVQPAWSPDGSLLAFSHDGSDMWSDIYTVKPDGTELTLKIYGSPSVIYHWLYQPSWAPDSRRLAVVGCGETWIPCEESRLMLFNGPAETTLMLTKGFTRPSWHPDGSVIAIGTAGVIAWVRPDGSARGIIVENGSDPAWRP